MCTTSVLDARVVEIKPRIEELTFSGAEDRYAITAQCVLHYDGYELNLCIDAVNKC